MFRSVPLPDEIPGKLYLHHMPGLSESWSEFEHYAQSVNLSLIVCLAYQEEIESLSPGYAEAIRTKRLPCFLVSYTITDHSIPTNRIEYSKFVQIITEKIREGSSVLVHCRAGVERTGLFASCILHQLGLSDLEVDELIRNAKGWPASVEEIRDFC